MIRLGRGQVAKTEKETVLYQYSLLLEEMDGFSQRKPRVQRNDSIHVHEKTASFRLHFSQGTCIIPVEGNKQKNADPYEEPVDRVDEYFITYSSLIVHGHSTATPCNHRITPSSAPGRVYPQSWR